MLIRLQFFPATALTTTNITAYITPDLPILQENYGQAGYKGDMSPTSLFRIACDILRDACDHHLRNLVLGCELHVNQLPGQGSVEGFFLPEPKL